MDADLIIEGLRQAEIFLRGFVTNKMILESALLGVERAAIEISRQMLFSDMETAEKILTYARENHKCPTK